MSAGQPDVRAVTFDLWATLLGSPLSGSSARERYRLDAIERALRDAGVGVERQIIADAMKAEWKHYDRIWAKEQRTLRNPERLQWLLEALGVEPLGESAAESVCAAFDESIFAGHPGFEPHVHEVVRALHVTGVPLGVISDTSFTTGRTMRRILEREGLLGYFEVFVFSDEQGRSKPHPFLFRQASDGLGVAPRHIAHVGDNPATDVRGALDAGFLAVWYAPDGGSAPEDSRPHLTIRSLDELPHVLRLC